MHNFRHLLIKLELLSLTQTVLEHGILEWNVPLLIRDAQLFNVNLEWVDVAVTLVAE